jgi:hypothetical protein
MRAHPYRVSSIVEVGTYRLFNQRVFRIYAELITNVPEVFLVALENAHPALINSGEPQLDKILRGCRERRGYLPQGFRIFPQRQLVNQCPEKVEDDGLVFLID